MKLKFKKLIALAVVVASSYKIGESIGKLKGSVDSMKFVLKQHPELDGLTVRGENGSITVTFEGKNDEKDAEEGTSTDESHASTDESFS